MNENSQRAGMSCGPLRSWLVRTEAGLAVHRAAARPALADDRELAPEALEPGAGDVVFSCGRSFVSSPRPNRWTSHAEGADREAARERRGEDSFS